MVNIFSLLIISLALNQSSSNVDMNAVRSSFTKAASSKAICGGMIEKLEPLTNDHLCLAYLGGFQAIWANHVMNPFSKLKTFKEGKRNIENAVSKVPGSWEIRLVRYSVQKNSPAFLDYGQHLKNDAAFIRKHLHSVTNPVLIQMANDLLKNQ